MKLYNPDLLHLTVAQSCKLIIVEIDVLELTAMLDQTRLPTIIVDYRRIYQALAEQRTTKQLVLKISERDQIDIDRRNSEQ